MLIQPYPLQGVALHYPSPSAPPSALYPHICCIVTERGIAPQPLLPKKHNPTCDIVGLLLNLGLNAAHQHIPEALSLSMLTLIDDIVGASYDIYNVGLGGGVGFAAEIGFSLDDGRGAYTSANFQAAIDRIHAIARSSLEHGQQYQTSPFSLRFVKASDAHLSMMEGRNTAMIEMDMVTGTYAGREIMYRYETSMYSLGGRPHWGIEFDHVTGSNNLIGKMYPKLDRWMAIYQQFNARRTFDNSFTQRVGFTVLK